MYMMPEAQPPKICRSRELLYDARDGPQQQAIRDAHATDTLRICSVLAKPRGIHAKTCYQHHALPLLERRKHPSDSRFTCSSNF